MTDRRQRQLVRTLRLLALLKQPRTIPALARRLQVSTRTIRRDLDALARTGRRVWVFHDGNYVLDMRDW